jgi:DNA-binding GntR family transcriptional regulator
VVSSLDIVRQPLNEQIANRIRADVLRGELKPGTRLVQADWAERLGTSRMPVRDAFLRLQAEGILTATDAGAALVAPITEDDIRDTYEIAATASAIAARRTCASLTADALAALQDVHEDFVRAVHDHDTELLCGSNDAFHRALNLGCRSPRLISTLRNLSLTMPALGVREIPEWREQAIEEHGEILAALRAGQCERVGTLMSGHVKEAGDIVTRYLRQRGFWDD